MDATGTSRVFSVFVRTTPERAWQAITDPELTAQYYYASRVESDWRPGSDYRYLIGGDQAIVGRCSRRTRRAGFVLTFDARWDEQVPAIPVDDHVGDRGGGTGVVQLDGGARGARRGQRDGGAGGAG